jgi:hypothetical protein
MQKPSQRISLRPTMFRTACDNSVTTSACPPADQQQTCASRNARQQTRFAPNKTGPTLATAPPPRASGSSQPITTPLPSAPTCGTGHVIPLRTLATSELAALNISARPQRGPPHQSPPLTPTCRRSRPAPPTHHAHQPALCQPTTATNTASSSFAPDSPLPGSPAIDRT